MKKLIVGALSTVPFFPAVLAGGYGSCGGMGGYYGSYVLYKLLGLIAVTLLVSIIFWWTYVWIVQDKGKLFKKKKK